MKQSSKKLLGVVAASALALGAATAAVAQGMGRGPCMGGQPGMAGWGPGSMRGMGPGMGGSVGATTEQLARTKSALGITAEQESAWNAYEQALVNRSALRVSHREAMMSSGIPPAGEQLAAMRRDGARVAQETMEARQNLYQVLTPEQKAKAGNLLGGRFGPRWAL